MGHCKADDRFGWEWYPVFDIKKSSIVEEYSRRKASKKEKPKYTLKVRSTVNLSVASTQPRQPRWLQDANWCYKPFLNLFN